MEHLDRTPDTPPRAPARIPGRAPARSRPETLHRDAETDPDHAARLDRLDRLAWNLDSRYRLPGTQIRFGWDVLLGLVPGLGDVAALAPASYIWLEAHRMGAPTHVKARMALNTGIDWVVGTIPLVGDIFDVGLKANRRNVALLRSHFGLPAADDDPTGA
ncbi:DUF4112 domain-containing protein [uncultured Jannaschia sp.]|uniref:DUF4112 domain-containing protein n=1 Tax=uncultured Jannaschia sp. TaxID=293347 RepID=UPI0026042E40|nr:DUF4112 domain-containing protein [uncultured Jannaschia sp.]